jgi:toxin ParE1/3/4
MIEVFFSTRAQSDLRTLVERIAADNPLAANSFAAQVEHHCSLLAVTPAMGRMRPNVGPGVRSLVEGNYLIFYRHVAHRHRVDILRIWHGRQRLPRIGRR